MNALKLLKEDHDYVKKCFKNFEKMDEADRPKLVKEVIKALKAHTEIEEKIFYPAVRKAIDEDDLMNEALVEHDSAKTLIRQLERMKPSNPRYAATFTVLGEYVKHHIDEEEKEMFPKARRNRVNLEALGKKMMERKIRLAKR
jgi:hemerythrin-like domain-containing protein